jgi:hypothetical protein
LGQFEVAAESLKKFFETLEKFSMVSTESFKSLYLKAAKIHNSFLLAVEKVKAVRQQMNRLERARVKAKQDTAA